MRDKLGRFIKGMIPHNKGKKYPELCGKNNPRYKRIKWVCKKCGKIRFVVLHKLKTNYCRQCYLKLKIEEYNIKKGKESPNYVKNKFVYIICSTCGKKKSRRKSYIRYFNKLRNNFYCSNSCSKKGKHNPLFGKHPHNFNNYSSFEPYGIEFNEKLKTKVRKRDKHTCQLCKKKEQKVKHSVHHIDYNKKNSNVDNLITLCRKCHCKTNFNREFYEWQLQIFMKIFYNNTNDRI